MRHKYFIMHNCAFMHNKYLPLDVYIQQGVGYINYTFRTHRSSVTSAIWLKKAFFSSRTLLWRHHERSGMSNHQRLDCLFDRLFRRWSKKTSKLRVTGLCEGNGEFPAQRASNTENAYFWWRHHESPKRVSFFKLGYEHGCTFWSGLGGRGTYTSKILKTYI